MSNTSLYTLLSEIISNRLALLKHTPVKTYGPSEGLQGDDHQAYIGHYCLMAQELLDTNEQHRLYTELELSFVQRLEYLGRYLQIVRHEVGKELP